MSASYATMPRISFPPISLRRRESYNLDRDWVVSDPKKDYDSDAWWERERDREEEEEFEKEKKAIARNGNVVHEKRRKMSRGTVNVKIVNEKKPATTTTMTTEGPPSFFRMTRRTLPTNPCSFSPSYYAHSQVS
jgi:hypothetical protein